MKASGTNWSSRRLLSISLLNLYIFTATDSISKFIFSGKWEEDYISKVWVTQDE